MLRVFLVEDESIIRETLRDTVPWGQYGYVFAGEAGDGEMALPLIRQIKPDVLITDIRIYKLLRAGICVYLRTHERGHV